MREYHKISTPFKRYKSGPQKGKLILGDWVSPELEYLAKNEWIFTEKIDGMNIRVGYDGNSVSFGGRTDAALLPVPLTEYLYDTFTVNRFKNAFDDDCSEIVLFGEGYGRKIQNGGKYGAEQRFILFDVCVDNWWLSKESVADIAAKLDIPAAPVLGTGTLQDAIDIVSTGITFNKGGGIVRWGSSKVPSGLASLIGDCEAEGIVAKPSVELFDRAGKRIITKIKAVDFK
jgi:hypothetical protein